MQCRHCLRYALGCCVKHGGRRPEWKEPLSLRLGDGRMFRLEFDCKQCQMNVYAADGVADGLNKKYKI
jgi:putative protease